MSTDRSLKVSIATIACIVEALLPARPCWVLTMVFAVFVIVNVVCVLTLSIVTSK